MTTGDDFGFEDIEEAVQAGWLLPMFYMIHEGHAIGIVQQEGYKAIGVEIDGELQTFGRTAMVVCGSETKELFYKDAFIAAINAARDAVERRSK